MLTERLVQGIGINDATEVVQPSVNGRQITCVFYATWARMLQRCYDEKYLSRHESYVGCYVCPEWLYFSKFKLWMEKQEHTNKVLDKDILVPGNKVYSPDTCCFVSQKLNKFLTARTLASGPCMLGVTKRGNKYIARCSNPFSGKREHLGTYSEELEAHLAWKRRKNEIAIMYAEIEKDQRIVEALINRFK